VVRNSTIEGNKDFTRLHSQKTPNCSFRLLNVIFHNAFAAYFQATGATMSHVELELQNGASEVTFLDMVVSNDKHNDQFDAFLFDSWVSVQNSW
jgi:hypothetical protein